MKTLAFSLLLLTMVVGLSTAQNVEIPDSAFLLALIEQGVDTNGDSLVSKTEAQAMKYINVSNKNIHSVEGIEAFINLDTLLLTGYWNSDWAGDPVYNSISTLDISAITGLKYLDCGGNWIRNLDLSKNTALKFLDCRLNWLTSLDISNNSELEVLNCYAVGFDSEYLTELDISQNPKLKRLSCYKNRISNLDASDNTSLTYLKCSDNFMENLNVSGASSLDTLICSFNELSSLNVSGCTSLIWLACHYNQLRSLEILNCISMKTLHCDRNELAGLDASNCTELEGLYSSQNQLAGVDVTGCPVLKELTLEKNSITNLNVTNNPELTLLQCAENKLTKLDVSNNIKLEYLVCGYNELNNLDISNHNALKWLSLSGMPSLVQVCVWTDLFPPDNLSIFQSGSPNISFTTDCTIGIEEYSLTYPSIYPNPANNLLTIKTDNPKPHTIEIHSLNGQLLYRTKMDRPSHQIDLTSFQKGLYFITVRSRDYVRTEKIIKL